MPFCKQFFLVRQHGCGSCFEFVWGSTLLEPTVSPTSPKVSGTQNGGTEPYNAILGLGFPLHKPYPYSLHRFSYLHFRYLKSLVTTPPPSAEVKTGDKEISIQIAQVWGVDTLVLGSFSWKP